MSDNVVKNFYENTHNKILLYEKNLHKKSQHYSNESIIKNIEKFNQAKEQIKQKIIASDKSQDNSVLYTAITQFKKTNE